MSDPFKQGETCGNSSVQYSDVPPRDVSFLSSTEQVIDCGLNLPQPVDNLTLKFPLGESKQYLDGLQVAFKARFQIKNADGTKLTEDKLMAPVCGIAGAVVSKMELWCSGRPVRTYNLYCYIYHILNLLHRGNRWFKTMGSVNGFIPDDTTADDDATWASNKGLALRREWAQRSKEFEMTDTLFCPVFLQERLIPMDNRQWSVHLHLNKSDFVLFKHEDTKGDYKLYLNQAELHLTKINLSERADQMVTRSDNLLIPFVDYDIQSFSLYEGLLQRTLATATLDSYPKRMYVALLAQAQVAGNPENNPFIYKNYSLETIQLDVAGQIYTCREMELEAGETKATPAYWNLLYRALGKTDGDFYLDIKTWSRMYTLFCFDITPSRFGAGCPMLTTPLEPVNYSLFLKFKNKLPEPLQALVLTETERVLTCSKDGSVSVTVADLSVKM